jgi:DsbC/DsbD-like thiol-disulfide interchange protein
MEVASVTYDSAALLREFAQRKGISYPMLSDPESKMIRAFGILNDNFPPDHAWYGVPFPGSYIVDARGIVQAQFFEEDHRERYTASSILTRHFGASGNPVSTVETKHLKLTVTASDAVLSPGSRGVLSLDVELKPGMHVYAPGAQGYIPIDWKVAESKAWLAHSPSYPPSEKLHLPAIQETVPVYQGRLRLARDLTIGQEREIAPVLNAARELVIEGSFRYQACDDKQCFPPQTVPLKWSFRVDRLDTQRAPADLQRKKAGK